MGPLKIYALSVAIVGGISAIVIGGIPIAQKVFNVPRSGYYMIDDEPYYYRKGHWWNYDYIDNDWCIYSDFNYTTDLYYDDYIGSTYDYTYDFSNIRDDAQYDEYYREYDSNDDDYDDYDYDYDSWDSGSTDWDSDW